DWSCSESSSRCSGRSAPWIGCGSARRMSWARSLIWRCSSWRPTVEARWTWMPSAVSSPNRWRTFQGFIESSKFEPGADDAPRIERLVADAQIVFLILLALLRHERELGPLPLPLREATGRLATGVATSLKTFAERLRGAGPVRAQTPVDVSSTMESPIWSDEG